MTIRKLMEIFEEKLACAEWDEDDEVWVKNGEGVFDEIDLVYKDSDGDIRITAWD